MGDDVPHLVRRWPTLIETLLGMKQKSWPQGWFENGKRTIVNDALERLKRGCTTLLNAVL
jgi:hypothetical protein